jgi:hypothetical protein
MEADWAVELAAGDPVIVVPWKGSILIEDPFSEGRAPARRISRFVDLRTSPSSIEEIEEVQRRPALKSALMALNSNPSPLWTAKCDTWEHAAEREIDPLEMDATIEDVRFTAGSYIDLLPIDPTAGTSFDIQEEWVQRLAKSIRSMEMRCARADFILRAAEVRGRFGFGVTWFLEACGSTAESAACTWARALELTLPPIMEVQWIQVRGSQDCGSEERYNNSSTGE